MSKTKAQSILERYGKATGKTIVEAQEEPVNPEKPVEEQAPAAPVSPEKEIVGKLISENFSKDNASQGAAADDMKKLAESDDKLANKFMEAIDDMTSCMQIQEDADAEAMFVFEPEKWKAMSEKYASKK